MFTALRWSVVFPSPENIVRNSSISYKFIVTHAQEGEDPEAVISDRVTLSADVDLIRNALADRDMRFAETVVRKMRAGYIMADARKKVAQYISAQKWQGDILFHDGPLSVELSQSWLRGGHGNLLVGLVWKAGQLITNVLSQEDEKSWNTDLAVILRHVEPLPQWWKGESYPETRSFFFLASVSSLPYRIDFVDTTTPEAELQERFARLHGERFDRFLEQRLGRDRLLPAALCEVLEYHNVLVGNEKVRESEDEWIEDLSDE